MAGEADTFLLLVLAFFFPPAAVAFVAGCGADLCLNILLTILGWLPGCIHAFWLIFRRAEANERYGYGNWTYTGMGEYYPRGQAPAGVGSGRGQAPPPPPPAPAPAPATAQYPADKQPQPNAPSTGYPGPPPDPPPSQQSVDAAPADKT